MMTANNTINLPPFCARKSDCRYYLRRPWSRDGHTYATDGRIAVRVPRRDDIPENEEAPDLERILKTSFSPKGAAYSLCTAMLPRGFSVSFSNRAAIFDGDLLGKLRPLSELVIFPRSALRGAPLSFAWDGGIGLVMPRRTPFSKHIEIEIEPVRQRRTRSVAKEVA
jgi:hypothetical protein